MRRGWLILIALVIAVSACETAPKHYLPLVGAGVGSFNAYAAYPRQVRNIPYVDDADARQVLDLYLPEPGEPAPVIVFLHGGHWRSGHRRLYAQMAETLCPQGYVVALVDYRLVPDVHYPAFMEDAVAALNWLYANIDTYGGDPERMIVSGHSAGSHILALLLVHDRFRSMLDFDVCELSGAVLFSGPFDFEQDNLLDEEFLRMMTVTEADFHEAQPINHPRADVPPLLVINGDRDVVTSEKQARRFAEAMQDAGADVEYVMLPGGDHISVVLDMTPRRRGPAYQAFIAFVRAHTGRPEC